MASNESYKTPAFLSRIRCFAPGDSSVINLSISIQVDRLVCIVSVESIKLQDTLFLGRSEKASYIHLLFEASSRSGCNYQYGA